MLEARSRGGRRAGGWSSSHFVPLQGQGPEEACFGEPCEKKEKNPKPIIFIHKMHIYTHKKYIYMTICNHNSELSSLNLVPVPFTLR